MRDYYKILGLNKNATFDDIKRAYRKLAHQYHPDKQGGDEKKFKEVNEAYQVLSNKEKRAAYDRFGTADFPGFTPGQGPFGGFGGFPGSGSPFGFDFDFSAGEGSTFHGDSGSFGNIGDIFDAFFEGLGVKPRRKSYRRGADLEMTEIITLEEAFSGIKKRISYGVPVTCSVCKGDGANLAAGSKTCDRCEGRGEIRETKKTFFGDFNQVRPCSKCGGNGNIPNEICKACSGTGRVSGSREVTIDLLPGIANGQIVKIQGVGETGERGAAAGDLYVRVKIKPHVRLTREGDDLLVSYEIDLVEALIKDEIMVQGIDGEKIRVSVPPGFDFKDSVIISGEGMPRFNSRGRGNLVVQFHMKKPKKINEKIKRALSEE